MVCGLGCRFQGVDAPAEVVRAHLDELEGRLRVPVPARSWFRGSVSVSGFWFQIPGSGFSFRVQTVQRGAPVLALRVELASVRREREARERVPVHRREVEGEPSVAVRGPGRGGGGEGGRHSC